MDDLHRVGDEPPVERYAPPSAPYTIDRAISDAVAAIDEVDATIETGEEEAASPSPDPIADEAGVQYWIWTGSRLVRASPEASERVRQREELAHEELRRLEGRRRAYRLRRRQALEHLIMRLVSPLWQFVATLHSWERNLKGRERVERVAEAHRNDTIG
ncbi:MAG: hypothetical protein ACLQUY_26140 [Ktedonobacterales bacterium]